MEKKKTKTIADLIEEKGGTRHNIPSSGSERAKTLSEVVDTMRKKGDSVSRFKKLAGIIPFAGAGMAAMSGDPAMAAEELAGDVPVAGQIYEAIKPEAAGNAEDDAMMMAESKAFSNYLNSPAAQSRKARLDEILSGKEAAPAAQAPAEEDDLIDDAAQAQKFNRLKGLFK